MPHNAREDTTRTNAQPTGREKVVVLLISAYISAPYVLLWHASRHQLQSVALRQVDVPLSRITFTDSQHIEPLITESLPHFITHFKTIEADAWAYLSHQLFGARAIDADHCLDSLLNNTLHRAPPASMYGSNSMMFVIAEQHGYAVGGAHANADVAEISH